MKLTEIFHALEAGELSAQTSLIDTVTGVKPENYNKVISHINLGLTNIYERFNIKLGDAYLLMLDGVAEYFLDSKYAYSNPNGDPNVRYILDSAATPFKDNAIKIVEAFTEIGEPLPINDRTEEKSIFTPSQLSVQIPWKNEGDVINIVYRAMHNDIKLQDYDDIGDIEVELPRIYLEPLLYYVAYRHFAGVGGQSGTPTSLGYFQKYQARLQEIELNGVPNKDLSASTDFQKGGWI
jgi:hypothetical protein